MLQKKVLLASLGVVAIGSTFFGVGIAGAQGTTGTNPSIVQRIAERFNLNQDEVQEVFDEQKSELHAQKRTELESRLNQAVTNGTITHAQRQAILSKLGEMESSQSADKARLHSISPEQHQQSIQQKRTELASWAQQNGLSLQTIQELVGHGGKGFGWYGGAVNHSPSTNQ